MWQALTALAGSPYPPRTNGRHRLFYTVVHAALRSLVLGFSWTWFSIWFPSPFSRSLSVGRKCSVAGCILQENKSKWFCAPGARQKAWNDNFSEMQSDDLKTFRVIFSISLREDIFSTVWTNSFKQWPWNHLSLSFLMFSCISITIEPN